MLLLIAAYFYKVGEREGAIAFFGAGTTLMGIKKFTPENTTTSITSTPPSTTVTTGPVNG